MEENKKKPDESLEERIDQGHQRNISDEDDKVGEINSSEESCKKWSQSSLKESAQKVQLSRHIIQLISFFLFPGLFITIYQSMRDIVSAVARENFHPAQMSSEIVLTVGLILVTIFLGRFFCGYMCAFGAVSDLLYTVFEKILPKKIHVPKKVDRYLKWIKYAVLGFLVIGVWIYAVPVDASYSPWNAFGGLISGNVNVIGKIFGTVGFFLLLGIFLGSIFIERFFCRYLCPLGAVFTPISKKRIFSIRRKNGSCNACGHCSRMCSMGIEVEKKDKVTSGECINCMKCTGSCPNEALESNVSSVAVGTAAAVAIAGLVCVGRISSNDFTNEASATVDHKMEKFKDDRGGHHPDFNNDQGSHPNFDKDFKNKDFSKDFGEEGNRNHKHGFKNGGRRSGQGNEQDGIDGRKRNFENDQGKGEYQKPEENREQEKSTEKNKETEQKEKQSQTGGDLDLSKISDGEYTGTGNGFRGEIKVKVTVKNHKIEDVSIESSRDDKQFLDKASTRLIQEIISSQSTDLDAVSGATFSSNGILEAVKNALN